ncbi:MAG TPA: DUF4242 domain-containing protein [Longimicrobiales bacterium]|nr:DUF4242 domain-containing protein [Longimicrobiales bacterium]
MPKYVIERDLPGAGQFSADQLTGIAQKSCAVLTDLGTSIQWIHSYVTDDKIYCVYMAPDEEMLLTHARRGGFPADVITRVHSIIEPVTAEAAATV